MNKILFVLFFVFVNSFSFAQNYEFEDIKLTHIKGAQKLSPPQFIKTENGKAIMIDKAGQANPALYDWNNDGKIDLLVGEFWKESKILVYLNNGTNKKPKYSNEPFYAENNKGEKLFIKGH